MTYSTWRTISSWELRKQFAVVKVGPLAFAGNAARRTIVVLIFRLA
jgi:hypothetical protein